MIIEAEELCRCGHPYRSHGGIIEGGSCQAGGCDLCECFELPDIEVVRKDDGLWLTFGAYAAISLDKILASHIGADGVRIGVGPIVEREVRVFCERRARAAA